MSSKSDKNSQSNDIVPSTDRTEKNKIENNGSASGTQNVGESTIRLMTRLAQQYDAVNLSQGFPNEPPPYATRLSLAMGILTGQSHALQPASTEERDLERQLMEFLSCNPKEGMDNEQNMMIGEKSETTDVLNQYSPPMGRPDLRQAVAEYYRKYYNYTDLDPESQITITLGATEAFATALRTVGKPGDKVVILQPFHELYPSQCSIFYLEPTYVTLRECKQTQEGDGGGWVLNMEELESALQDPKAKVLALNTPHNPTGKVFTHKELSKIVGLCLKHNVTIVTDEIYEHMTYDDHKPHLLLPQAFPEIASQCFICNSIGKSASATGWRVGWCLHPSSYSPMYRGIHDQLVVMSPHPMQYATIQYLHQDCYPKEIRNRYQARLSQLGDTLREVGFEVPNLSLSSKESSSNGSDDNTLRLPVEGAYYLFVKYGNVPSLAKYVGKPMEAAMYMLKEVGVACVPGDNFYGSSVPERGQYLRFAACRSVEDVTAACERIRRKFGMSNSKLN